MRNFILAVALVAVAVAASPVIAQSTGRSVAGAASGSFPSGAALGALSVSGLQLGTGVLIEADGSAAGTFHAVLHAAGTRAVVEAKVTQGNVAEDGTVTFSGTGTLDLGDGTAPAAVGWVNVSIGPAGIVLSIDSATLAIQIEKGEIVVE